MKNYLNFIVVLFTLLTFFSCSKEDEEIVKITPQPVLPFVLEHEGLPIPNIPQDNKLTNKGIALGRKLFYEKLLSQDNSQSCATCHVQSNAFADTNKFSVGVSGFNGKRQAMAIFNMAWNTNEFFWDGRAHLLRNQSLMPIQDSLEMNETLPNVIAKLSNNANYVAEFTNVFGNSGVTELNISLALEQFMNSIVSNNSKYDLFLRNQATLTAEEERGRELFFTQYDPLQPNLPFANCAQCHGGANFENSSYMNNGLDTDQNMTDFGRSNVTNSLFEKGAFKVPSLRNIALTPPYMHDGRFETLEEVIDHYSTGIQNSATVNPTLLSVASLGPLLNNQEKSDLIAFLHTLTDNRLRTNSSYADPF